MTSLTNAPKRSTNRAPPTTTTATPMTATTATTATTAMNAVADVVDVDRAALVGDGVDSGSPRRQGALPALSSSSTTVPIATAAPRRGLTPGATLPAGLDEAARANLRAAVDGGQGAAAQTATRALLASPAYRALPTTSQATLLNTFTDDSATTATAQEASSLLASSAFQAGAGDTRAQLVDVHAASPAGRAALLKLAGDDRLAGRDFSGQGTLLGHLHSLATAPVAQGIDRAAVLASTLGETADPTSIEQHGQATCVATSVSLEVVRHSPAEYARIATGLASPTGSVALRDGSNLQRAAGTIDNTASGRSPSERLIQDAFTEFGNGRLAYDVGTDSNSIAGANRGGGLTITEAARLQSSVFGERFGAITTRGRAITRDATPRESNLVTLRNTLDKLTFRRAENQPINRVRDQMADGQTPLVAMRWGSGADLFHAVVVDRIEGDRVYFRNPHGGAWHGQPAGSTLDPPPRRVEGGNVESMRFEDFRTRLDSVSWQR